MLAEAVVPEMNAELFEASDLNVIEIILQKEENLHAQSDFFIRGHQLRLLTGPFVTLNGSF